MAYTYITTATTTQVKTGKVYKAEIIVNSALTGSITVIDGTAGTTANVAVITNPGVGAVFPYRDLQNGLRIITSAVCDITVNHQSNNRGV